MTSLSAHLPPRFKRRAGIDCFVAPEDPSAEDVDGFFDGLATLRRHAEAESVSPPFRLMVDCTAMQRLHARARAVTYRRKGEVQDWRIAVVGRTVFQRLVVEFLRVATGVRGVKYFTDEARARQWLADGGP